MKIIGLDSAVDEQKNGLVLFEYNNTDKLTFTALWDHHQDIVAQICDWLEDGEQSLIGIDSPLGWPLQFSKGLQDHYAGMYLGKDANAFFRRETDIDIARRFHKTPLEVSADRIGRTAFMTLKRIREISERSGREISLVWNARDNYAAGFIEVYPAATLLANKLDIKGYKKDYEVRLKIVTELKRRYLIQGIDGIDIAKIDHNFDACLCCFAAYDFLTGKSKAPEVITERIKREGWIWTRAIEQ
ncbi:DUF429 domain-containing protein [Marispirochaeta sp.]|uniref:DUF429 domain-containing protein n=1 Tax=Marispirochaeta sp. TaxID=2038653 RepID=UPI0029C76727|nr:DUF429 domain-containing protein [Marispirochaeta sp.]